MSVNDIAGILRKVSSGLSVVRFTPQEEDRIRQLVKEIDEIYSGASNRSNPDWSHQPER
jgi:hypothetical protein